MNGLFENLEKIMPEAEKMMYYGTKLALGVLLIGFFAYKYNQWHIGSYENTVFCIEIVRSAFSLFVQFIIGGIILDCASHSR